MTYVLNATGRVHLNGSWTHTALSLPIHRQYGQNVTLTINLAALAEHLAKTISRRLMARPAGLRPPPNIKSFPCEKWRLASSARPFANTPIPAGKIG